MDFAPFMTAVATELWGPPRPGATKTEIRFGDGRTINPQKGTWWDHGAETGGGVLSLIEHETGRKGSEAVEWLKERGFHVDDLPDRPAQRQQQAKPKAQKAAPSDGGGKRAPKADGPPWKIVHSWDYVDEEGNVVLRVDRMENGEVDAETGKPIKSYRQRQPDPTSKDGWNWKGKGARLVPYRLPEVIEAIAQGLLVFVVEGEKAADRLWSSGIPATTNPGGAGKWPADFAEYFAGADVVILPDNDPQARRPDGSMKYHPDGRPVFVGADHAEAVAASLAPVASSVRVVPLPGVPLKGDVVDFLDLGGTPDQLYDIADTVRTWAPTSTFKTAFGAIPWARMDDPGPEHEWLVKGWISRGERSVCAGVSQSGKSFFVIDLAMAVARGIDFFGAKTLQGGVCYQAGEGGRGVKKRIRAYRQRNGLTASDPVPFVLLPAMVDLYGGDDGANKLVAECRHWAETFAPIPLELVIIDTWSAATPGANENASEDVSKVLARLDTVSRALNCHVMLVHHMNSEGKKIRGHTSILANIETVIIIEKDDALRDAQRRHIREAKIPKQKDGEADKSVRFVLEQVELGRDADDDPITSCVVSKPDKGLAEHGEELAPAGKGWSVKGQEMLLLRSIADAVEKHGLSAPSGVQLPSYIKCVEWPNVRDVFARTAFEGIDEDDPIRAKEKVKKALQRHGTALMEKRIIGRTTVDGKAYVWLTGVKVKGFGGTFAPQREDGSNVIPFDRSKPVATDPDDPFGDVIA